jgi:hypothetical protein
MFHKAGGNAVPTILEILERVGWEHRQPIFWGDLSQRSGNTWDLGNIHERESQPGGANYS